MAHMRDEEVGSPGSRHTAFLATIVHKAHLGDCVSVINVNGTDLVEIYGDSSLVDSGLKTSIRGVKQITFLRDALTKVLERHGVK